MSDRSDHYEITGAGWAYRTNSSGWIIYLNPQTGIWQTQSQAIASIRSQVPNASTGTGQPTAIPAAE